MATQIDRKDFSIKVKGKSLPVTMFIYDDGGASVQTVGGGLFATEYAKVGGNNNWSFNEQSLLNYAKTKDSTITAQDITKALYTEATTGSGSGGYFNTIRASGLTDNLTIDKVTQFAEAGVPGLKASYGDHAGQTKNADGSWSGAVAQASLPDPTPSPDPDPTPITVPTAPISGEIARKGSDGKISYGNHYYPLDIYDTTQDLITFTVIEKLPTSITPLTASQLGGFKPSYSTENLGSVTLPIQPIISDNNRVDWAGMQLNAIDAQLASLSYSAAQSAATGGLAGLGNFTEGIFDAGSKLIAKDSSIQEGIRVYLAQQAAGVQGLLSRTSGAVLNPNMELLFRGPQLRPFNFTFKLSPREVDEAKMVRKIIRLFKESMSVQSTANNVFLKSPFVYKIQYKTTKKKKNSTDSTTYIDHPSINKIKECALLDCSINYTPDGTYMTFDDEERTMSSYTMTLQFQEIEPVYNKDYADVPSEDHIGY